MRRILGKNPARFSSLLAHDLGGTTACCRVVCGPAASDVSSVAGAADVELASLRALCRCAAAVSRLRSHRSRAAPDWEAALEELAAAQAVHQQAFHAAYPASARPTHHYRLHHPEQLRNLGHYVDMFPVEACHQRYKGSTADHYAHLVNRAGGALCRRAVAIPTKPGGPYDHQNSDRRSFGQMIVKKPYGREKR